MSAASGLAKGYPATMNVLVTGAAGFIGASVATALLNRGDDVVGFDNLNSYYDPTLKQARLNRLLGRSRFEFVRGDLTDTDALGLAFGRGPRRIIHLAAQPGVRYSITNPHIYVDSNISGTLNVLEACRHHGIEHFVYASSSSVYGANTAMPFATHHNVDHPISLYAATKKATELLAHTYSHLFAIPTTGLRFFTVYGPWGRPDMAPSLFTRSILEGRPLDVYNGGAMARDFTYIDDIVEAVLRITDAVAAPNLSWSGNQPDPATSVAPYRLYNVGSGNPVALRSFIRLIEEALGRTAILNLLPMQPGDVASTFADVADLKRDIEYSPETPLRTGIGHFVDWYCDYHKVCRRGRGEGTPFGK